MKLLEEELKSRIKIIEESKYESCNLFAELISEIKRVYKYTISKIVKISRINYKYMNDFEKMSV